MKFVLKLLALFGCFVVCEVTLNAAQNKQINIKALAQERLKRRVAIQPVDMSHEKSPALQSASRSSAASFSAVSSQAAEEQGPFIPFALEKKNDNEFSSFYEKLVKATNYKFFKDGFPKQWLNDVEYFTQERWGELQKPLLVAMVITERETAEGKKETCIQPYRAHNFNRWLLETSEYRTKRFRPDPLTRVSFYSKDVYYFTLTHDSLKYLCILDELVAHDNFGKELRNTFLINAGNDPYATASAIGIPYVQFAQGKVLEQGFVCGPVNFYPEIERSTFSLAIQAIQKTFSEHFLDSKLHMAKEQRAPFEERCKQLEIRYYSLLRELSKRNDEYRKDPLQYTRSVLAGSQGFVSRSWEALYEGYKNLYDDYCRVLGHELVYVPDYTNAIVLARDMWDKMASTASPVAEINGQRELAVGEYLHRPHEEPRDQRVGKLIGAAALPFVLAFGVGVLNNWLARRSGCGLARWPILKAPLREWIAGGIVHPLQLLSVEYLCKRGFNAYRTKFGKDMDWKVRLFYRLGLNGFMVQICAGLLQEYGESMPLPGYEGWRSLELLPPQARFGANNLSMHIGLWSTFGSSIGMIGAGLWYGGRGLYHLMR